MQDGTLNNHSDCITKHNSGCLSTDETETAISVDRCKARDGYTPIRRKGALFSRPFQKISHHFQQDTNRRNKHQESQVQDFSQVWLSLVNYSRGRAHAQFIIEYRELINRHLVDYLRITNYQRPDFVYAQRSAIIESTNIYTAYANSVHLRFGQHPRRVVNALLNTQQRIVDLRRVLSTQGMDDDEIKHRIRQDIILPAQTFKQAISQQPIDMEQVPQEPIYTRALHTLQPVFDAYDRGYNFGQQGLYYDVKRNPVNHFKAFYQLSRLFEHLGLPVFNCFPLRRSWSPCYVTIDSKILCQNILGIRWSNAVDRLDYWARVIPWHYSN
ncbi:hypothetical protein G6F68_008761 [Rhizopus microsporus]|nr:hypothetical protein G6F69_008863 [Rhizopus microsporus]KAG1258444.1 hypothetical protein G6F68_008761 [Rhizopus microsporus]